MPGAHSLSLLPDESKGLVLGHPVRKDWRLLEVDERLLEEIIDSGVTIKGTPDEEAVLCTRKATFALKHVETTNSLFLIPGPSQAAVAARPGDVTVAATADAVIELAPTAPRFAGLDRILQATQVTGEDDEPGPSGRDSLAMQPHTFDELLDATQASAAELRQALQRRGAAEMGGAWRVIAPAYLGHLLEMLLLSAAQHGWDLAAVPVAEACRVLEEDGFDPLVAKHCLMLHAAEAGGGTATQEAPAAVQLDAHKVCRHCARRLLEEQPRWPLHDFMSRWRAALPEGMAPDAGMLRGEALVDEEGGITVVRALCAQALPAEPAQRFAVLFAARPRWQLADLQPYIADLQVPGRSAEALLLMHARTSQEDAAAPVLYSPRTPQA